MEFPKSIAILQALSSGTDPAPGKDLKPESPFHNGDVVRALYVAIDAVKRRAESEKRKASQPGNAGRKWSNEEDRKLKEGFASGQRISSLAQSSARSDGAVVARLVMLRCINPDSIRP